MRRLAYREVIEINRELGEGGHILNNNLEFVIDTANDIEDDIGYATTLLYEIPRAHSFADGNKRTAFFAFAEFLKLNGYRLRKKPAFNDKMVRILNDIARGKTKKDKVERMIKSLTMAKAHM